eukprot:snap_masked-scaffold_18-processed-gene-1.30-mRNA-1 protein AED:1.00 eAED:1.00 QI:0/-1/0/0/-1/1/1/0/59
MECELSTDVIKGLNIRDLDNAEIIMADGSNQLEDAVEIISVSHVLCKKNWLATLDSVAF